MPTSTRSLICSVPLSACLGLCGMVLLLAAGCDKPTSTDSSAAHKPADATYTVRGKVEMVPSRDKPTAEFVVLHEPIDDFVDPKGARGMNSMSMPFPLAPGTSVEGIAAGDAVEITFGVWYTPDKSAIASFRATGVRKLPGDTQLRFGKASPTLGEPGK